jgi:hypothetical protein
MKLNNGRLVPVFSMFGLLLFIGWQLVFARYVAWNTDRRTLPPDTYTVDVYTPAEYAQLIDPTVAEVRLAHGRTLKKGPGWDDAAIAGLKSVDDGSHYVMVRTLGRAHAWPFLLSALLPLAIYAAINLGVIAWSVRASSPESLASGSLRAATPAGHAS